MAVDVAVFYSFARSGGTLINRCLGSIPGNLVLSEVNPHGAGVPVAVQARDWLGLVPPSESAAFSAQPYGLQITALAESAARQGAHLVIRDWSALNFVRGIYFDYFCPSMVLEQPLYLERHGVRARGAVIVRRAAAVYGSLTRTFEHLRDMPAADFGRCYLAYARAVSGLPRISFERFCASPPAELQRLCQSLGVAYDDAFVTRFASFDRCTGDTSLPVASRAGRSDRIMALPDDMTSAAWSAARADPNCEEADRLLGYA
jgi:hypothetical protein